MALDNVVGKDGKAYYSTSSVYATPAWVLMNKVMDVSVNLGKNMADLNSRESPWNYKGAGLKTAQISFGYLHQVGDDTVFDALLDSYVADTVVPLLLLDGLLATSNSQGLRGYFIISAMDQDQALEEGFSYSFTADPVRWVESGTSYPPEWHKVA